MEIEPHSTLYYEVKVKILYEPPNASRVPSMLRGQE